MHTMTDTINLDGLTVTVQDAGEDTPPWGSSDVFKYRVTVTDDATTYETDAWGSQHDYENGTKDGEGIGWMVLDELLGAAYDADEFWTMAIGDERPSRQRVERVNHVIDSAAAMYEALDRNADAINAHR